MIIPTISSQYRYWGIWSEIPGYWGTNRATKAPKNAGIFDQKPKYRYCDETVGMIVWAVTKDRRQWQFWKIIIHNRGCVLTAVALGSIQPCGPLLHVNPPLSPPFSLQSFSCPTKIKSQKYILKNKYWQSVKRFTLNVLFVTGCQCKVFIATFILYLQTYNTKSLFPFWH